MRYRDSLLEMAVTYLNKKENRNDDMQLLLSNHPNKKEARSELLQSVVDEIKELIKEKA